MSKYKSGDCVLLEGKLDKEYREHYQICINGQYVLVEKDCVYSNFKTYEQGLQDAWELARKIVLQTSKGGMPEEDMKSIFGERWTLSNILKNHTAQEALAKIETYEESKAIEVGDVVETGGNLAVVVSFGTFKVKDDSIHVVYFDGVTNCLRKDNKSIKKTGRHIDIEHLLEQIRGNE